MNLEELSRLFSTSEQDFERVRELGAIITPDIDRYIELFYEYLTQARNQGTVYLFGK